MDLTLQGSALTALFVAMVWALVKTVEYFISKRNGKNGKHFSEKQSTEIEEICKLTKELYAQHTVYDENHTPLWYMPRELIAFIRNIHNNVERIDEIKVGQAALFEKMTELLTSQILLTQRLSDLVTKLDRISS